MLLLLEGYATYSELVKSKDAFQMLVIPNEGREMEGLKAALLEAEKVKRFGFTNSELERAKTDLLKNIETAYKERENQKSQDLIREYVRNFLSNELIPGIEWEYQTMQMLLPRINADMVNQMAKAYVTDKNLIVSIMSPDKEAVKVPTEAEIRDAIAASKKAELTAKAEEDMNKPLIKNAPKAGKVKKVAKNQILGTEEWTLSNGVKVIFKATKFKEDEILLSAFSEGGFSKVKNVEDLPSAMMATSIISNNGLGDYNQIELNKLLTGKIVKVTPSIATYEEGFDGSSSVNDFETMLQLIYLNFTAPRKDDNSYKALMNMYRASLANSVSDPRKAFSDSVSMMINIEINVQ